MRRAAVLLAIVTLAGAARADEPFWTAGEPAAARPEARALTMATGDVYLQQARLGAYAEWQNAGMPRSAGKWGPRVQADARAALLAYEKAIAVRDDAKARYRAFIAAGYLDSREGFENVIEHAEGLRAIDPEDPHEWALADELAVAHSKLGASGGPDADAHFDRAIEEYRVARGFIDAVDDNIGMLTTNITNSAEIMMARGLLDDAIAAYREANELNPDGPNSALTLVGLAVAYDRDDQWENATRAMNKAFLRANGNIEGVLTQPGVFFVPDGDIHYYRALSFHMKGKVKDALREYEIYLVTCVSDRYKARARAHVAELEAGRGKAR